MKIQVFGTGCAKCHDLYENVKNIVKELNLNLDVEYSDDVTKIIALGVMSGPAFVIDDKVITSGRIPGSNEIREAISGNIDFSEDKNNGGCCRCC